MEGLKCLATIGLVVLVLMVDEVWSVGDGRGVFQLATSSNTGSVLCAVSDVNQTTLVSELPQTTADLPSPVRCAYGCVSQSQACHSFNYRSDNDSCQFYYYFPTNLQSVTNCAYYQYQVSLFQVRLP